jgi:Undecaprenyl-phosphate galactose phosphotransferase WbaP
MAGTGARLPGAGEDMRLARNRKAGPQASWQAAFRQGAFVLMLLSCDVAAVALSFSLAFLLRKHAPFLSPLLHGLDIYLDAGLALLLWPLMFSQQGLYPAYWLTAGDELRRAAAGTTLASLLAIALTFVTRTELLYSRPILVGGWALSLLLVPLARFGARRLAKRLGLSGPPAVILGAGEIAEKVVDALRRQVPPALQPVALFDDDPARTGARIEGIEVTGPIGQAPDWAKAHGVTTAILALPETERARVTPMIESHDMAFSRIIAVSDVFGASGAEVVARQLPEVLALELRKNLLSRSSLALKRGLDLALLAASLVVTLPLAGMISLAILLESGRPAIFGHPRIGKGGRSFTVWKFRSMVGDAEAVLREAVADVPALRQEWEAQRKLRADPRLTRVGWLLRRTSLDELPQLWNVLSGEMSLVGPRPIVEEEVSRYGRSFDLYRRVPPGLTGLWQVSGRSNTSYADRVRLDVHYVRSWSIWMDLVILARTLGVVIRGDGAY